MRTVEMMRRFGFKSFYGDPTRPDLLHAAGIEGAKVLIVSLDDKDAAVNLLKYARANDRIHVYELFAAGANDIVRKMFDSSLRAGRYALESMGYDAYDAAVFEKEFFNEDRRILRELAPLWDPEVKITDNPDYIQRAKEPRA